MSERPGESGARFIAWALFVIVGCLLVVLWDAQSADALTIAESAGYPATGYILNTNPSGEPKLGTGLSGTLESVDYVSRVTSAYTGSDRLAVRISCYNDSGYSSPCSGAAADVYACSSTTTLAVEGGYSFKNLSVIATSGGTCATPETYTFDPSKYYALQFNLSFLNGYIDRYGYGNAFHQATFRVNSPVVLPDSSTITSLTPADGSTTASTSVSVSVGYYVAPGDGWSTVGYTIYNIDRNYAQEASGEASTTPGTLATYDSTRTLRSNGAYSLQAYLRNDTTGAMLFSGPDATGTNNVGDSQFAVVSNPMPGIIGASSTRDLYVLATSTCSVTNVTGCFQNAIAWAFFPSAEVLDLLGNAGESVRNKPPFGYFFVNVDSLRAFSASGTAPFVLSSSTPITLYIFHPLDLGLGGLIGFFALVWLLLRVRKVEV